MKAEIRIFYHILLTGLTIILNSQNLLHHQCSNAIQWSYVLCMLAFVKVHCMRKRSLEFPSQKCSSVSGGWLVLVELAMQCDRRSQLLLEGSSIEKVVYVVGGMCELRSASYRQRCIELRRFYRLHQRSFPLRKEPNLESWLEISII